MGVQSRLQEEDPRALVLLGIGVVLLVGDDLGIGFDPTGLLIDTGMSPRIAPGLITALTLGCLLYGLYLRGQSTDEAETEPQESDPLVDSWIASAPVPVQLLIAGAFAVPLFGIVLLLIPPSISTAISVGIQLVAGTSRQVAFEAAHVGLGGVITLAVVGSIARSVWAEWYPLTSGQNQTQEAPEK